MVLLLNGPPSPLNSSLILASPRTVKRMKNPLWAKIQREISTPSRILFRTSGVTVWGVKVPLLDSHYTSLMQGPEERRSFYSLPLHFSFCCSLPLFGEPRKEKTTNIVPETQQPVLSRLSKNMCPDSMSELCHCACGGWRAYSWQPANQWLWLSERNEKMEMRDPEGVSVDARFLTNILTKDCRISNVQKWIGATAEKTACLASDHLFPGLTMSSTTV